ncbi:protein-ADP-ribose hydrolase [Clostridium mediterraneense]|uniref:protein-ADP-ribose hydrolase n=1 Tax=Clostridium mediterraneense TaxID=1805472 RepID=UPI000833667A|nr:protein-ADP-ribose hydrolase [Clostridium mediterraneense]
MSKIDDLDFLISELCSEKEEYKNLLIPEDKDGKRALLRSLMNVREARKVSKEFLEVQDRFLKEESIKKGIVKLEEIQTIKDKFPKNGLKYSDKISLWQGDITRLEVDAIVNAANSQMLGCFVPCHRCIDNAIHSAAGVELRRECFEIMKKQGHEEEIGKAKLTSAYNLPSKYVLHTVGPIVSYELTDKLRKNLESCYKSCLRLAVENNIRSIAFCCISTGEFHFPNDEAAKIALDIILKFLENNSDSIDRIIINVFKDEDYDIYKNLII